MSDTSQRALVRLQARIRACTKCVEAGYLPTAFPIVAGKARDRVMIISQAPGAIELTTGLPFSGRAGAELRRWLAQAGVDEARLPYRTSVTKCFPGKAATGAVGTLAIERLWRRAPLRDVVGKCRIDGDRVLIPLPHPSRASRWLNQP